ncbi:2-succinyl-5-enolpyruvyl-6-hydroxy-3-cyclohexene-1-carboxylic-acid synthase [Sporolactobacillus shoreae]|uniref:2-succinyl-5-enolpyruvyl-6-hydroxy-3-cyclohexene-1-carboxylate synthase n=1 Tax=Sporolactobacillus shoreae TaxID=1465501 RepID=A0A4Z0GJE7_9BACL|nr:2-succinyl-5-enolpyruvyl-6-hydroxy-3-cyclohexene-1-carboxylic-acid synthase [Sporolactobacillus shoreae]TGA96065.1 2-succinyl-5-enolpyruvyl-6-hydroxy-3-cyclohexene-1-carboxylic-acid synthase [Sporolactobacillus shoreae]
MDHAEVLSAYLTALIDEMVKSGVTDVVLSPGSRSTPLALLFANRKEISIYLDIDERSAGFLALGMAKARRKPVALLCTSGTAAANYFPATIEAFYSRVPLIVLTADRPYELQDVGAPQTIDQSGMYGSHVKRFAEIQIPEYDTRLIGHTRILCARAIAAADSSPRGPVHLNFPLREPLLPDMKYCSANPLELKSVSVKAGRVTLDAQTLSPIVQTIRKSRKGVIICGGLDSEEFEEKITFLADKIGFPILADPLSQLRRGTHSLRNVIEGYDAFLRDAQAATLFKPDLIIRFGAMPVSKALKIWIENQKTAQFVVDGGSRWRDPSGSATEMIYCDESWFCKAITDAVPASSDDTWLNLWKRVNQETKDILSGVGDEKTLNEEKVFFQLNRLLPDHSSLFIGNSMPVRELDTFLFTDQSDLKLFANRGASGIDGVVSTAVGVSLVRENTFLVIGDLSFFHDMNGLLAAKQHRANLTIILINNDGGGIFSFLPQASEKKYFEALYGTPHGLDFAYTADLYGADYKKVDNWDEFGHSFLASFQKKGLKIIEIPTDREENVHIRKRLFTQIGQSVAADAGWKKP